MLGKVEGKRRRGRQNIRWLDSIIDSMAMNLSKLEDSGGQGSLVCCSPWGCRITHDLATGKAQATSRTGQCQSKGNGVGIKVKMLLVYDGRLGLRFLYTMLPFSINYVCLRFWQLRFYFLKVGQICFLFHIKMDKGFHCGSAGKDSACNTGYLGLIPGLGRSLGEGKGYFGLENSMDCIVHGVAKSWT